MIMYFKNKPRILIRAFTCRRDVASALILEKCLKFLGCEVIVSSIRDFSRNLKYWKPDVAVSNVLNTSYHVKKINSNIKTVFFDGEGLLPNDMSHHITLKNNPHLMKSIDMYLLWGDVVFKEIKSAFPHLKNIHVVGWSNLDFIRYNSWDINKKTIGFVMRSPVINDHQGVPTIRTICNPGNLGRVKQQCESFVTSFECIKEILEKTSYNVSIRPHPLEQIDSYNKYKNFWFKENASRVKVDETLCFAEWLMSQKLIVSPTSTSSLEAYLLKVPIINIDFLAGNVEMNREHAQCCAEWQDLAYLPKTLEELIKLINSPDCKVKNDEIIEKQLQNYCNWHVPGSYSLRASKLIRDLIPIKSGLKIRFPTFLIKLFDEYSFWKQCKINPLHPNLNYKKNFHKPVKELDKIFLNIMNDKNNYILNN